MLASYKVHRTRFEGLIKFPVFCKVTSMDRVRIKEEVTLSGDWVSQVPRGETLKPCYSRDFHRHD